MKAIVLNNYGDATNLSIAEVPTPKPNSDEVLIKVQYFSLSPLEVKIRKGEGKLFVKKKLPMILGSDFGGQVIKVGDGINEFVSGDYIMGSVDPFKDSGPYAEYICTKPGRIIKKPDALDPTVGSFCAVSGISALQVLRDLGNLQSGQRILILGGSSSLGHLAIQMAKNIGAHVTAVSSYKNHVFLKSLGVDEVIDYQCNNVFLKENNYHLIFDAVNKYKFHEAKAALLKGGIYINTVPSPALLFQTLLNPFRNKKVKVLMLKFNQKDLEKIALQLSRNEIKLHIEKIFEGLESIHEATKNIESERVVGKIGIKLW